MHKLNDIEIERHNSDGIPLYYISVGDMKYLHSDGAVRHSTQNEEGENTGYFLIKREAQNMLKAYKKMKRFEQFLNIGNSEIQKAIQKEMNEK